MRIPVGLLQFSKGTNYWNWMVRFPEQLCDLYSSKNRSFDFLGGNTMSPLSDGDEDKDFGDLLHLQEDIFLWFIFYVICYINIIYFFFRCIFFSETAFSFFLRLAIFAFSFLCNRTIIFLFLQQRNPRSLYSLCIKSSVPLNCIFFLHVIFFLCIFFNFVFVARCFLSY